MRCMHFWTTGAVEGVLWLPRWNEGWGLTLLLFVEKSSSAGGGWSCPGPPRSPYDQALLCPEPGVPWW